MKTILYIFFVTILINLNNNLIAQSFNIGNKINGYFNLNNDINIKLNPGDWTVIRNQSEGIPKQKIIGIGRVENNEIVEIIEVYEGILAGYYVYYVDPIITELVFKNKHDGCYERAEYLILELYRKGSSFNCMIVRHIDIVKELKYPDDPKGKAAASAYNFWINQNSLTYPKILLASYHTYFSRTAGGKWYEIRRFINPKLLNAPKSKFLNEETSEYHKYNISQFPQHEKTMNKWVSMSSKFHKEFENMVNAKNQHKLSLESYLIDNEIKFKSDDKILDQLNKLNELFKSGILTEEEFTKAKKKVLN
jgi:hypothetical protein